MRARLEFSLDEDPQDDVALLRSIADELEAQGEDVDSLRDLSEELEAYERPPGLLRRVSKRARDVALKQWSLVVGEYEESVEAAQLIGVSMRGERELSTEERTKVKEQVLDLMRVVPAGLIVAVNSVVPVPGTSVFLPWVLIRLGLMPSRWREAHLLAQLRKQEARLRQAGRTDQAEKISTIVSQLEHAADEREAIQRESALLSHWDANGNGVWDDDERAAYDAEVARVRELVASRPGRKRWFFEYEGEVYGPTKLSDLGEVGKLDELQASLLLSFDGKTGWVALADVFGAA